jgi:hypothetical protein
MKMKPKSCGCRMCRLLKATPGGNWQRKCEERAFRHRCKVELAKGADNLLPAPHGSYIA